MKTLTIAAVVAVAVLTACGPKTPDYQSIWDSTSTTAPASTLPTGEKPVPIALYLEQSGVIASPMTPETLTDITVTLPAPSGWLVADDPNLVNTYEVLRKPVETSYPPTAMLFVFKLMGDFDVAEAIAHGNVDAQMSEGFTELQASTEDFDGMPSSMIESSYDLVGLRMHTYNRIVIPTSAPPAAERYLVQFTVTTAAQEAAAWAPDVEALIDGFSVTVP